MIDAVNPDIEQVIIGARRFLDEKSGGMVVVDYYDDEKEKYRSVEICPSGARALAKELRTWANIIDPPAPRRRTAGRTSWR